jgi:TolB-like protein
MSATVSFKGQTLQIPEIARRLNVAHIFEGSVRKAADGFTDVAGCHMD